MLILGRDSEDLCKNLCCFGKQNSTLWSVVPLAMFHQIIMHSDHYGHYHEYQQHIKESPPSQMQRNHGWFDEQESSNDSPDFITELVAVEEVT